MTSGIVDPKYPKQGVWDIKKAGFENTLIDFGEYYKLSIDKNPLQEEDINKVYQQFVECCRKEKLNLPIAFIPDFNKILKEKKNNNKLSDKQMVDWMKECIEICGNNGCKYVVVNPMSDETIGDLNYRERYSKIYERNTKLYLSIAETAKVNQMKILLGNEYYNLNGHYVRSIGSDADKVVQWIDSLNEKIQQDVFGFCLDVGVCNLCGQNIREYTVMLGNRIKVVVIRDSDGQKDISLLPFTSVGQGKSTTDWLGVIRGLREINFDGEMVLDFKDTALAFSPLLKPVLLQLARYVVEYLRWQIHMEYVLKKYSSIVLFGAGNMCRNYMKCYGEKYPPLFTCDNNSSIWGTTFCGLDVKSPKELKNISVDCVILICNIYYREIEEQLRSMEITNPIEFFNDEYMPDFYFERIEEMGG